MGLFSIKRAKPKEKKGIFAVKNETKQEDTLEVENEKLDKEMSKSYEEMEEENDIQS